MNRLVVVVLCGMALLAACGSNSDGGGAAKTEGATVPNPSAGGLAAGEVACAPATTTLQIVASSTKFDTGCLPAIAGRTLTLSFDNRDGAKHSFAILRSHDSADVLYRSDIIQGPALTTLDLPAIEPGTYVFHCEVHPNQMKGTLIVSGDSGSTATTTSGASETTSGPGNGHSGASGH